MQEAPGHRADPVEECQGLFGPIPADGASRDKQSQMAVHLPGRTIGESPEVRPVATGSAVTFGEVRRN